MDILHFTLEEAKNYIISYHFLNSNHKLKGHEGIKTLFDRIGSIQYDPLNVVGMNTDLVLQSRISNYKAEMLNDALYKKRYLIDGWDKQMCIYQTKDFPNFKSVRDERAEAQLQGQLKYLKLDIFDYVDDVLEIITKNGPTYSSEIKLGERIQATWGSSKPSNETLAYLWHKGIIGIKERRNTQKKYDLMSRLIGNLAIEASPFNNESDFIKWLMLRRIKSLGLVWNKSSIAWSGLHIGTKKIREEYLNILLNEGHIKKVNIANFNEDFYISSDYKNIECPSDEISFIAPLDNLIWDRDLTKKLFNYDYRWEVYTPVKKRVYGYYVLPVLYGNTFIGRIEFEQQRNSDPLIVKNFWWEENIKPSKKIIEEINKALVKFAKYLGTVNIKNMEVVKIPN